jgi:hypothetical protein
MPYTEIDALVEAMRQVEDAMKVLREKREALARLLVVYSVPGPSDRDDPTIAIVASETVHILSDPRYSASLLAKRRL